MTLHQWWGVTCGFFGDLLTDAYSTAYQVARRCKDLIGRLVALLCFPVRVVRAARMAWRLWQQAAPWVLELQTMELVVDPAALRALLTVVQSLTQADAERLGQLLTTFGVPTEAPPPPGPPPLDRGLRATLEAIQYQLTTLSGILQRVATYLSTRSV